MLAITRARRFAIAIALGIFAAGFLPPGGPAGTTGSPSAASIQRQASPAPPSKLDHSGRKRVGEASFYARKFTGRKMANGKKMDPKGNNAASRTLPLGTKATVTNLKTGQRSEVKIEDRGPYAKGRIIDLSPATAEKIGIEPKAGVGQVEVAPITVPQPDGSVKPGAGARDTNADQRPAGNHGG